MEIMCLALLVFRDQASCKLLKDSWLKYVLPKFNSCIRLSLDWENIHYYFEFSFSNAVIVGQL